ncbi:MAG: hypothetical protein QM778_33710 [Myxococcales bacterium]
MLAAAGCDSNAPAGPTNYDDDEDQEVHGGALPLIEDRTISYTPWTVSGETNTPGQPKNDVRLVTAGTDGSKTYNELLGAIRDACGWETLGLVLSVAAQQIGDTSNLTMVANPVADQCAQLSLPPGPLTASSAEVGPGGVFFYTCMGHKAMTIADAASTIYVSAGSSAISTSRPTGNLSFTIAPPKPSDRASWALLAADAFREAVQIGTNVFANCGDTAFKHDFVRQGSTTVVATLDIADQYSANLLESASGVVEAAEKAAKHLHASAQAAQATTGDRSKARKTAWRHPYDSLLRAASAYVKVPGALYDTMSASGDSVTAEGTYPVVSSLATTDADRLAENLLRQHRVDPRIGSTRTVDDVANDIIASVNEDNQGAFESSLGHGIEFLAASQGIKTEDLIRAANRLTQAASVLGRPVRGYLELAKYPPAGQSGLQLKRVSGFEKTSEPANPWYLFATTETAELPNLDTSAQSGGGDVAYARRGIFHALEWYRSAYPRIATRTDLSTVTKRALASADGFASHYVGGRIYIGKTPGPTSPVRVRIIEHGTVPPTTTADIADYMARYDMWLGEEGLLCALRGVDGSGAACNESLFRFGEAYGQDTTTTINDLKYPYLIAGAANAPAGFVLTDEPRVYVTKTLPTTETGTGNALRVLLAGFRAQYSPGPGPERGFYVPISSGLSEALQNTLGVDPLAPDETAALCGKGGLPRNIKVGLEDELLQAQGVNGSNTIEESWAYYLQLAKNAALEADMLGNELVDQGLTMDMRAEDARDELEDLCGGVVNVADLRDQACAMSNCDLVKYLDPKGNTDGKTNEAVAQLRECLGIETDTVREAVLGSNPVCVWQMKPHLPCQCPGPNDLDHASYQSCPGREYASDEAWVSDSGPLPSMACAVPVTNPKIRRDEDCRELYVPLSDGSYAYPDTVSFHFLDHELGLVPKLKPGGDGTTSQSPCKALAQARDGQLTAEQLNELLSDGRLGWSRKSLGEVAKRLSVDRDDLNFVKIKRDDVTWLSTGKSSSQNDPNPWLAKSSFPCAAMAGMGCKTDQVNKSLLCSMSCNSGQTDAQMANGREAVGERLAMATEVMRALSGAGMQGIDVVFSPNFDIDRNGYRPWALFQKGVNEDPWGYLNSSETSGPAKLKTVGLHTLQTREISFSNLASCDVAAWFSPGANHDLGSKQYCEGRLALYLSSSDYENIGPDPWPYIFRESKILTTGATVRRDGTRIVKTLETELKNTKKATGICLLAEGSTHPFPPRGSGIGAGRPYDCDGNVLSNAPQDQDPTKHLWRMDAGDIDSWPRESGADLTNFWATTIRSLLEGALRDQKGLDWNLEYGARYLDDRAVQTSLGIQRSWPLLSSYTVDQMLDALELACIADTTNTTLNQQQLTGGLDIGGYEDLARARLALEARANQMEQTARGVVLSDFPESLQTQLKNKGVANIYPSFGAAYAQTVNRLYGALQGVASTLVSAAGEARAAGYALESVQSQLREADYRKESNAEAALRDIGVLQDQCTAGMNRAIMGLAAASAAALGMNSYYNPGQTTQGFISATADLNAAQSLCSSNHAQQTSTLALSRLANAQVNEQTKQIISDAAQAMVTRQTTIENTWSSLLTGLGDAQAALADLAAQRSAARRAAAKVLMLDNDDMGHQFNVNTTMRARFNTLRVRYERARDYAVRMAYLARRSIEQKIGLELNTLGEDVGWVPAPQGWADKICSLSGIDYKKIRDAKAQEADQQNSGEDYTYADEYVGDYVKRLEEFITAYQNTYSSHDGEDTVVVSVRDELLGLRNNACEVSGCNELLQTVASMESSPLGSEEDDPRPQSLLEQVWDRTCTDDGRCAQRTTVPDDVPFVAFGKDALGHVVPASDTVPPQDSPSWGGLTNIVKAVRLTSSLAGATSSGGTVAPAATVPVPTAPPAVQTAWYRADQCTETAQGSNAIASCTDLSGNNRPATVNVPANAHWIASGIGGKKTIEMANALMAPATNATATDRYTISGVYRQASGITAVFASYGTANGVNQQTTVNVQFSSADVLWASVSAMNDASGASTLPNTVLYGGLPRAPENRSEVAFIFTLVADGPNGTRLYVNGHLNTGSRLPVPPVLLPSRIFYPLNGASGQWAETVAYSRPLNDAELQQLHGYLAGRYGLDINQPYGWIEGDDLQRANSNGGASAVSGFSGNTNLVFDRILGRRYGAFGAGAAATAPNGLVPIVTAPATHYGLHFEGDDSVLLYLYGSQCDRPNGGTTCVTAGSDAPTDWMFTIAGKVETDGGHTLFSSNMIGGNTASLDVNSVAGSVGVTLRDQQGNVTTVSTPNNQVHTNQVFAVSMRASRATGRLELFVNGKKGATLPWYANLTAYQYLGTNSYGGRLKGSIGDYMFHERPVSDAEILQLHQTLATKYGIQLAPVSADPQALANQKPEYRQYVNLASGKYLLSWYERTDGAVGGAALTPHVVTASGTDVPCTTGGTLHTGDERWLAPGWVRSWVTCNVGGGDHWVGWKLPSTTDRPEGVLFAAPQLELVDSTDSSVGPKAFFPTDDDFYAPIGVCEDRGGEKFRATSWQSGCEVYCPPSLGLNCATLASDTSKLPQRCYHELKFSISQEAIEKGKLIPQGGFAAGNFNYRWEQVAVNAVGTAVKNCESSEVASACYANNFLQYSLRHDGPFVVRNYLGREYEAPLFPGRIQQGKALLAERYLTNPMSGADRTLLQDFWDYEFVGRPIEGNYTLRIYGTEADGLDWEKLEDIQLALHYRYWTRLQ